MIRVRFSVLEVLSFLLLSLVVLALGQQQANQPCILPNGRAGRCIQLENCTEIAWLVNRKVLYPGEPQTITAVLSACGSDGDSLDPIVCCEAPALSPARKMKLPVLCGTTREHQPTYRIVSDATDDDNVHVWAVLLEINKTDSKTPARCAGTLIQERFVLTAAHCVFKLPKENIKLFFGVSKISKLQQCLVLGECQERGAAEFIIHPEYNPHARANDIALIWLNNTVDLDSVVPACLPLNYTLDESVSHETRVHSVGWGINESGE
ncbi:CLIP domain-containing serine protease B15-like [Anopheles moucheti]|uniref:CLIP domain-containing serine protease B15-like n=1 Tax=Anopheles moucheti TaxID=186751 RepID=UPI0022F0EE7F|nr:CLIP domain-containing serine protease B15-like [Anopheles moucheti]